MRSHKGIRPQDVVVLLKLCLDESLKQKRVGCITLFKPSGSV